MRFVLLPAWVLAILLLASARPDARVWIVDQRSPNASDTAAATPAAPYRTINRAAEQARPGDTVLVREGVYRERVAPEKSGLPGKPIVYRAAPGEVVTIKGSEVWKPEWKPVNGSPSVYRGKLDSALFVRTSAGRTLADYNPFRVHRYVNDTNLTFGRVFVDGEPLQEVSRLQDLTPRPGTWMAGRTGGELYVNLPPRSRSINTCVVEITTRGRVFAPYIRGTSYIVVQGFVMEHCGNQYPEDFYGKGPAQAGLLGCRGGNHWIIENNVIRFAKTIGIDCGAEGGEDADGLKQRQLRRSGYQIIRNNDICDNGAAGIIGESVPGTLILGNRIERNNREGFFGMEGGGIKVHALSDGLIEGNLIRDNGICGLWLDNGAANTRVTRNVVVNNTGAGIFMELGTGPTIIDNNIIALTTCGGGLAGDGFYSHDASNVTLAHNGASVPDSRSWD